MRILYVSPELNPYTPQNTMSNAALELPRMAKKKGGDVRIFMPKFGVINERRHQLHEVIRLSGMNMIINDIDQPLIIKVASLPSDRMQVYFIDNDEYFKRKGIYHDKKTGDLYLDNDERAIFFTKGILETIKKLNWKPDVIHAQGWMAALMPLYLKTYYSDDPFFDEIKIVYSLFDKPFDGNLGEDVMDKILFDKIDKQNFSHLENPTFNNLLKVGIDHADFVVQGDEVLPEEIMDYIREVDKPFREYEQSETLYDLYLSLGNDEKE